MELNEQIKKHRTEMKLSQEELAEKNRGTTRHLNQYKRGQEQNLSFFVVKLVLITFQKQIANKSQKSVLYNTNPIPVYERIKT